MGTPTMATRRRPIYRRPFQAGAASTDVALDRTSRGEDLVTGLIGAVTAAGALVDGFCNVK